MLRKKSAALDRSSSSTTIIKSNTCLCGRAFFGKGWYARHVLSCRTHLTQKSSTTPADSAPEMCDNFNQLVSNSVISLMLDNLIELEGLEEDGDYDDDDSNMHNVKLNEVNSDQEEISFDSNFASNILIDDS